MENNSLEACQRHSQKGCPIKLQRYFIVSTILMTLFFLTACAPRHRYKPVVKYQYPSRAALQKTLRTTYGDRYRYAGQGPNRFDCSGLTYYSYATMNLWLPRRAIDQSKRGTTVPLSRLRYGDLIFFDTHKHFRRRVNHVGIYVGKGNFLHASSSKKRVITSSLHSSYYQNRIIVCKRMIS